MAGSRRRTRSQRSNNASRSGVVNASNFTSATPSTAASKASKAAVIASRSTIPLELIAPKLSQATGKKRPTETRETKVTQVVS